MKVRARRIIMPKVLHDILDDDVKKNEEDNELNIISHIDFSKKTTRKVDILLLCVFYGLYKSKKLPEMDSTNLMSDNDDFSGSYEFNVDISEEATVLSHLLFSLWTGIKGFPEKDKDQFEYRKELYHFLEHIIDPDFMLKEIFPFYLQKANEKIEDEPSFISRLSISRYLPWRANIYSPENLMCEYTEVRKGFEELIKNVQVLPEKTNI